MSDFRIVAVRGSLDESVHHVSAVVVRPDGTLVAHTGNADLLTYWRSASKPFQLLPLVEDEHPLIAEHAAWAVAEIRRREV